MKLFHCIFYTMHYMSGLEARGISYWVPDTCDKVEDKKSEGRFMLEGEGRQSASGSGDTTAPHLIGQETGDSGVMGGLTTNI